MFKHNKIERQQPFTSDKHHTCNRASIELSSRPAGGIVRGRAKRQWVANLSRFARIGPRYIALGALLAALTVAVSMTPDARASTLVQMFGASAVYMPRLPYLAKLQGVLETYRRQRDHEPGLGVNPAVWERFQAVLRRIETGTEMDQIQAVNAFFNRVPYESDETTYGTNDYWATPYEFLSANAGDCEDYAIAKLLALQEVGVEPQRLRLVIVRDEQLKRAHVVVTALVDGRVWILDNLTPTVVEWHMAGPRYRPLYSVNGSGAWLYRAGT